MMVLLDTYAFLWLMTGDSRLGENARNSYLDPENRIFLSIASFWEIGIKISRGRLRLSNNWETSISNEMKTNSINWLPIESKHCAGLVELPFHHRDPFDRMIICQAITGGMHLISNDRSFAKYDISIIW